MHNLSTVDSVSSVQRVAEGQPQGINHGFAASANVVDHPNGGNQHVIVPMADKDSAEIYGNEE